MVTNEIFADLNQDKIEELKSQVTSLNSQVTSLTNQLAQVEKVERATVNSNPSNSLVFIGLSKSLDLYNGFMITMQIRDSNYITNLQSQDNRYNLLVSSLYYNSGQIIGANCMYWNGSVGAYLQTTNTDLSVSFSGKEVSLRHTGFQQDYLYFGTRAAYVYTYDISKAYGGTFFIVAW